MDLVKRETACAFIRQMTSLGLMPPNEEARLMTLIMTSPSIDDEVVISATMLSKISRVLVESALQETTQSYAGYAKVPESHISRYLNANVIHSVLLIVNGEGTPIAAVGLYQSSVVPTVYNQKPIMDPTSLSQITSLAMSIESVRSAIISGTTRTTRRMTGQSPFFSLMLRGR